MFEISKPHLEECSKDHEVSLDNLKEMEDNNDEEFSCFMSCFLKKIEVVSMSFVGRIPENLFSTPIISE